MGLIVVNPDTEILQRFENYQVITDEGQVVTGLIVDRDNQVVILWAAKG